MTHRATRFVAVAVRGASRSALLGLYLYAAASSAATPSGLAPPAAAALPVPCSAVAACGAAGLTNWITQGTATLSTSGSTLTVSQQSNSLQLNWSNFNIGSGSTVTFVQPGTTSVALNRIYQQDPTQIFGSLNSNGSVYLLNPNGFLFGQGSITNVGGLVASSLNISPQALASGLAGAALSAAPAFQPFTDASGNPINGGAVTVASGATITAPGGQVMLFAPDVLNAGTVSTPDGQTLIGAGQRVFLAASTDPDVRGLLIEVGTGGTATNDVSGLISADRGNVTIAGLAVNQLGRVSATTTVNVNGSVILKARDTAATTLASQGNLQFDETGTLTLGPGSSTAVTLEGSSTQTAVDVTPQPKSRIDLFGADVLVEDSAQVTATGGTVNISAVSPAGLLAGAAPDDSRVYLAPNAVIDVSGATDVLPMSANSLTLQLRGTELADSPQQRDGALRCTATTCPSISVDLRQHGVNPDGSVWIGTPLANLTADIAAIPHDVFYRNLTAGTVNITSTGSVLQAPSSVINISGGQIDWQAGYVKSSILLGADGIAYNIASANPSRTYVGTLDTVSTSDPHWGTAAAAAQFGRDPRGVYTPAYVQGFDAGAVHVLAPNVVLGGNINGSAIAGPLQVNPATAIPDGQLYRFADQIPLGGLLTVGNGGAVSDTSQTEFTGPVTFAAAPWAALQAAAGGAFDPVNGVLPANFTSLVGPGAYGVGGASRIEVYSTGVISVPQDVPVDLNPGGSLTLAGEQVVVDSALRVPSGSVLLEALPTFATAAGSSIGVHLGADASVDVSGEWINEGQSAGATTQTNPNQAQWLNGGSISLVSQQGSLELDAGSALSANGGALRSPLGAVTAGTGGTIKLLNTGAAGQTLVNLDGTLSAFGLSNGGSLTIGLPSACLTSTGACTSPTAVPLSTGLLTDDGFRSVTLGATGGSFTVESDVNVTAQQTNWQLTSAAALQASSTGLGGLVKSTLLPDYLRNPMALSFYSTSSTGFYGDLTVAAGATLSTDPLGSIALKTDSRIFDQGTLLAPGGSVSLTIAGIIQPAQYLADQGIWLTDTAVVNVSGVDVYRPNALGLLQGSVLPGGSINVTAGSGFVYVMPGASLLANGTSGSVDIRASTGSSVYNRVDVGSAGGSIAVQAAEGLILAGDLSAAAGEGTGATGLTPSGGTLSVRLDGNLGAPGTRLDQSYPVGDSVLNVLAGAAPDGVAPGVAAPAGLQGNGYVSADTINAGGFDRLVLGSATEVTTAGSALHTSGIGTVAFEGGVTLVAGVSLQVDAARIRGLGDGSVTLVAPYVQLGNYSTVVQDTATTPTSGPTQLEVDANVLDLTGSFAIDGFSSSALTAYQDMRLVGVSLPADHHYVGNLYVGGALSLTAQQIYPTTLSQYSINLVNPDPALSALLLPGGGGPGAPVLSAAGSMTFNASSITSGGTLLAPFGSIALNAPSITLLPGSVTSVSGNGQTIPFGEIQGGLDWIYPLNGYTQVYSVASANALLPPQKQIRLNGQTLDLQSGAQIDVSGGGDLLAFEFTAGLGGSNDVLSNLTSPNLYAIVPSLNLPVAPIDPLYSQGFNLAPGTSVYLAGGGGLAAGTYTLLPARYALLDGGYLVQAVSGYGDLSPLSPLTQLNGGTIMAGAITSAGTSIGGTRTSGFLVEPGTYALQEASYTTSTANAFFTAQATAAGVAPGRLPADAGALSLVASQSIALSGTLDAAHAAGARGATVSIAGADLYVTDTTDSSPVPPGSVALNASDLNALGAERLVLGADQTPVTGGVVLTDLSSSVRLGGAAQLTGSDVVLVGSSAVTLDSGASVTAAGPVVNNAGTVGLPGGAALLEVTTGHAPTLVAGTDSGAAALTLSAGSTVTTPGALALYSGGRVDLSGQVNASGANLEFGAPVVAIGDAPTGFAGLDITSTLLQTLGAARLTLDSPNAVTVYGSPSATLSSLTVLSPGVTLAPGGGSVSLAADAVTLGNPYAAAAGAVGTGAGTLSLSGQTVSLNGGTVALGGAATTTITATQGVIANATTQLTAAGDLTVNAPSWSATGDYDTSVNAAGALVLGTAGTPSTPTAAAPGAGFSFSGSSVTVNTAVHANAGVINVTATAGSIDVQSGALLDVSGAQNDFAGTPVSVGGGTVALSAQGGDIGVDAGAVVDVSQGTGTGAGGSLRLVAPDGAVQLAGTARATAGAGAPGANLTVDAATLPFDALVAANGAGNFTGNWAVRQRGAGDLAVASGETLTVSGLDLTTDQGAVTLAGTVDARSASGGSVRVSAAGDLTVTGSVLADATGSSQRGGHIELASAAGGLYLEAGSVLSAGGTVNGTVYNTGTVLLTASRDAVLSAADASGARFVANGTIAGARDIAVEGLQRYDTGGTVDATTTESDAGNPIYADAQNFVLAAQPIVASILPGARVAPGIEIDSTGDLHVSSGWDLSTWRFGANNDVAGIVTLRAAGSLYVDQSISDGFTSLTSGTLLAGSGPSFALRLIGGADLTSANLLAVNDTAAGDVIVAPGLPGSGRVAPQSTVVRTGTGFIDIAAAADVVLGNAESVVYSAGVADPTALHFNDRESGLRNPAFPIDSGNVSVFAGRDVVGAPSSQLFSDWLWRSGVSVANGTYVPTAWTVSFANFSQGFASFGGGDVSVDALRNVLDLNAAVPTVGIPRGNGTAAGTVTTASGDGLLSVSAGNDIEGGRLLGMGAGLVMTAGGSVTSGSDMGGNGALYPILGIANDAATVSARQDATLETVLNPTFLPRSSVQPVRVLSAPQYFSTYGDASDLSVTSAGGDTTLAVRVNDIASEAPTLPFLIGISNNYTVPLQVLPGSATLTAYAGNVTIANTVDFAPAPYGTLNLYAGRSIVIGAENGVGSVQVNQSDLDPATLGTVANPNNALSTFDNLDAGTAFNPSVHAPSPVHGGAYSSSGLMDTVPNDWVALTGNIDMQPADVNANAIFLSAKPVTLYAGNDIVNLGLSAQNLSAASVDTVTAGRDLVYTAGRDIYGNVIQNTRLVDVAGPGALLVTAGRNVNLQTSYGITTSGNLSNAALPTDGASIAVVAGANGKAQYAAFAQTYLVDSSTYDTQLADYLELVTGTRPGSKAAALAEFATLSAGQQDRLLDSLFVDEVRAGGRAAAAAGAGHNDFSRAFAALETLFPGSNPDLAQGQSNPNLGDILLYFSRIYTLLGGDIDLLAPGGQINVGLAAAPTTFGITKPPSDLGIVAQQTGSVNLVAYTDVQVNQSRIFAADGGNILIWSTDGNIDAGRGAKSAISAPPPTITVSPDGRVTTVFPPALTGSGIQTIATSPGTTPGDVDLFAPHGVVNANDAGIVAGNLTIAATAVIGSNNISVSGNSVGVPVQSSGLGVGVAAAGSSGAAASSVASSSSDASDRPASTPVAQAAMSYLDVIVLGLGEDNCRPDDVDCMRRQKHN